jgi:hypothetical protein
VTPTFHAVLKETLKPLRDRQLADPLGLANQLSEYHFFDVSSVLEMARDLGNRFVRNRPVGTMAFLPAQKTALDLGVIGGTRFGVLLEEVDDGAVMSMVTSDSHKYFIRPAAWMGLGDSASNEFRMGDPSDLAYQAVGRMVPLIYGALALINTPRVIGRRQHMPHAGLQRRLAAARGMVGKFPLRAWTEIVLEVTPPKEAGPELHEARLTGGKCLHFCRAHLRIRNGCLEFVSPHWRGDPALGIKQTRYAVVPPRQRAA